MTIVSHGSRGSLPIPGHQWVLLYGSHICILLVVQIYFNSDKILENFKKWTRLLKCLTSVLFSCFCIYQVKVPSCFGNHSKLKNSLWKFELCLQDADEHGTLVFNADLIKLYNNRHVVISLRFPTCQDFFFGIFTLFGIF